MSAPVGICAAGAVLAQVVPLDVSRFPLVEGATKLGALVPLPKITLFAVRVVAPVPPLATPSVPVWSLRDKDDTRTFTVPAALQIQIFPSVALTAISPATKPVGTVEAV